MSVAAKVAPQFLLAGCVEHLTAVWDESRGLFPYSTRLVDGRFSNDYEHPDAIRYTINSLLGLAECARAGGAGPSVADVSELVSTFLARHEGDVVTCADAGLLTLLLADYGDPDAPALDASLARLEAHLRQPVATHNVQDLAWALWGACGAARARPSSSDRLLQATFESITSNLVVPSSRLPRHSTRRYRRNLVSFGGLVYFLRAMHEYQQATGDEEAGALFERGVRLALDLQGSRGEWPWLISGASGAIVDAYPVFSVHQDSMAMLFLLPALDQGMPGVGDAVSRSLAWCFGENELALDFYVRDPFFAYRSIERVDRAPRLRRYLRSLVPSARSSAFGGSDVRLNPECRSYHLGWILYAWSGRPEVSGRLSG